MVLMTREQAEHLLDAYAILYHKDGWDDKTKVLHEVILDAMVEKERIVYPLTIYPNVWQKPIVTYTPYTVTSSTGVGA